MTHEEYWDYLIKIYYDMKDRGGEFTPQIPFAEMVFKLTASPYYYWLGNQSIAQSSPKGSESPVDDSSSSCPTGDSPNLSDKAQEIRSKLKDFTKRHEGKYTDFMSQEAFYGLGDLIRDWAQGCRSWWIGLDSIPDSELVKWNTKHEVFV